MTIQESDRLINSQLLELFDEMSFQEKWERVFEGLKKPKNTGEYKFAQLQIIRLSAPIAALSSILFAIILLMIISVSNAEPERTYSVIMQEPERMVQTLEEIIQPPDPPEIQEPTEDFIDTTKISDSVVVGPPNNNIAFSPQIANYETVAIIKSPIAFQGIFSSRNPGSIGSSLGKYNGSSAGEDAVMKALRWLKSVQLPDGSWPSTKPAMTGFAVLTFLAHGETPSSVEFGATVERAIYFLMDNISEDGKFKGSDGHEYSQPIAAYALSEAYGMTKNPAAKEAARKGIRRIIKGQNPSGGFNYNLDKSGRDDTSYMAWCAQALKAAKIANLFDTEEMEVLDNAIKKSISGFQANYKGDSGDKGYATGGFGYTSPGNGGLTAAGTLCMQLLGSNKEIEIKGGLRSMDPWTFQWEGDNYGSTIYYAYYGTQAKFHEGGDTWKKWNAQFSPALVKNQTVIPNAIANAKGVMVDIGYWDSKTSGHSDNGEGKRVMTTCLCTLMLEVYYRYLPTFDVAEKDTAVPTKDVSKNNKLEITI